MSRALPPRPDVPRRPDVPAPPRRRRGGWLAAAIALILVAASGGWVVRDLADRDPVAAPSSSLPVSGGPAGTDAPQGPFRFLQRTEDGEPLGWNPCRPIPYEVNLRYAPDHAAEIVATATERVGEATGFTFSYLGTTRRGPIATLRDGYLDRVYQPLPVLISWLPPSKFEVLAPPERAAAIGHPERGRGPNYHWYTSGQIVVNNGAHTRAAFVTRWDLGPVLLHEWGHVLGLKHVADGDQIMWSNRVPDADPYPAPLLTAYGDGDLAGLARLASVSCEAP